MKQKHKPYKPIQMASAVFMMLALIWLTISAPFVYADQLKQAEQAGKIITSPLADSNEEEDANPFGDTTEEKNPSSGISFSEEYIHDHHSDTYISSLALQYHKCENAGVYTAFHGDLEVPPPDVA